MAALEDKIRIPAQPCNILYISKSVFALLLILK